MGSFQYRIRPTSVDHLLGEGQVIMEVILGFNETDEMIMYSYNFLSLSSLVHSLSAPERLK